VLLKHLPSRWTERIGKRISPTVTLDLQVNQIGRGRRKIHARDHLRHASVIPSSEPLKQDLQTQAAAPHSEKEVVELILKGGEARSLSGHRGQADGRGGGESGVLLAMAQERWIFQIA
jgi:hypothetical protein